MAAWKVRRVGVLLRAARVEHRREVGAAAEPPLAGHHDARVHVHGRHVRVHGMGDERDAGGPEARVLRRRRGSACGTRVRTRRTRSRCGRRPSRTRGRASGWHDAAAALGRRCGPFRSQGVRTKRPGGRSASGAPAGRSASSRSKAAHKSSRSVSNQLRAALLLHVERSGAGRHVQKIPASMLMLPRDRLAPCARCAMRRALDATTSRGGPAMIVIIATSAADGRPRLRVRPQLASLTDCGARIQTKTGLRRRCSPCGRRPCFLLVARGRPLAAAKAKVRGLACSAGSRPALTPFRTSRPRGRRTRCWPSTSISSSRSGRCSPFSWWRGSWAR